MPFLDCFCRDLRDPCRPVQITEVVSKYLELLLQNCGRFSFTTTRHLPPFIDLFIPISFTNLLLFIVLNAENIYHFLQFDSAFFQILYILLCFDKSQYLNVLIALHL